MTRPSIPYPDLETEIHARMQPVSAQDRWFWVRVAGYFAATIFIKAGAIAAFVLMSPVIVGIWVVRKLRTGWK